MSLNIYNPTTQQLTEVAGLDVKDSLEKVATLPTPTADYLNQVYILVGTQEGYHVGSIYQCRYINSAYTWVEITGSVVGKADKVSNATNNHLAKLTADGNLADSGIAVGDLGTAINKNWTDLVRPNSHDLVESNAVYSAITNAISSIYTPHGDITCAELVPALLIDENIGNVYTVTDSGATTAYFMQGAGKTINTGDSVSIIKAGETSILFNLMGNVLDLTDYQKKNLTTPLTIGDTTQTTVEGALGALNTTKATQVEVNDIVNVLGAKNILKNEVTTNNSWSGVSRTVNADGTITLNGTSTAWSFANFNYVQGQKSIPSGTYIISGGCENTALAVIADGSVIARQYGSGETVFTITDDMVETYARFEMLTDKTFTSESSIIKPMIRLVSITDDTYVPYAETNYQLTQNKMNYADNGILGAKNFINNFICSITANSGVTLTINDDGSIVMNGTVTTSECIFPHGMSWGDNFQNRIYHIEPSTSYIFSVRSTTISGLILQVYYKATSSSSWTYLAGTNTASQLKFTTPSSFYDIWIRFKFNKDAVIDNIDFYPMVRLASDLDDTYVPYAMTNKELTDEKVSYKYLGEVGVKNILPYPYNETTKTVNGVTFTDNGDGTVTIATDSGGATAHTRFYFQNINNDFDLENRRYILSDNSNDSANLYSEVALYNGTTYQNVVYRTTNAGKVTFKLTDTPIRDRLTVYIQVRSGYTNTTGITFKPMIRLAEDADPTWKPYAMTNKELTDNKVGWDSNGLLGAKNLDGTIRKSQTSNGITFTVNSDGTVTANGTSTASTNQFSDYFIAPITGQVILSGGVNVNAHIFPWDDTDNARPYADSTQTTRVSSSIDAYGTQEVSFYMIKGHKYRMIVRIYSGTTVSNVTFKPMIRLATDTDTTYVPYAQTNQELSRNSFGNFVNITSYNSASNRYVCPCDGYAYIQENSTNNDGGTIKIYSGDGTNTYMVIGIYQVVTGSYPSFSTYVKKGMQLETYHMVGNAIAYFVPLV